MAVEYLQNVHLIIVDDVVPELAKLALQDTRKHAVFNNFTWFFKDVGSLRRAEQIMWYDAWKDVDCSHILFVQWDGWILDSSQWQDSWLEYMTPWENFAPYRHGEVGWNSWPIPTPLACYGCDVNEPPSEFYPCRKTGSEHNACMQSFDPKMVVETALRAMVEDKR